MADRRNVIRAQHYRERVELFLTGSDLDVTIPPPHRGRGRAEAGDVFGLDSWSVLVQSDYRHDWGPELDAAQRDGREHAAVIGYRTGQRLASEQFVTMTLADFAAVLRKTEGAKVP